MSLKDREKIIFHLNEEIYSDLDSRFFLTWKDPKDPAPGGRKYVPASPHMLLWATSVNCRFNSETTTSLKESEWKRLKVDEFIPGPRSHPEFDDLAMYPKSYSLTQNTNEEIEICLKLTDSERHHLGGGIGAFGEEECFERFTLTIYKSARGKPSIECRLKNSFHAPLSTQYESPANVVVHFYKTLLPKDFEALKNNLLQLSSRSRLLVVIDGLGGIYRSEYGVGSPFKALLFQRHILVGAEKFFNHFPEMRLKTYFDWASVKRIDISVQNLIELNSSDHE